METLAQKIRTQLGSADGQRLPLRADERLGRLEIASPLYTQLLARNPEIAIWLETPSNRDVHFRYSALLNIWNNEFFNQADPEEIIFDNLRKFRRQLSLRIAYREINALCTLEASMQEHSLLADFCIQTVAAILHQKYEKRFGEPWLESSNRPASYTVLALGKLGGMELNFCSDIDLIYFYENEGTCIKNGQKTALTNQGYFQRFFQELTNILQKRTAEGFLFNVDLRLRPEGGNSSIAKTIPFAESYYWDRGQTWERMAYIKARPCCGSIPLGEELLESLNPYRYPRLIPPNIIEEVTHLKTRTENENLGASRQMSDIKSGKGGIREIEYIAQTLQLLNGGKMPFIQSRETLEALKRLNRYSLLPGDDAKTLQHAYIFLRSLENALQMREEKQTHSLPNEKGAQADLANLFLEKDYPSLLKSIDAHRTCVHQLYKKLLPKTEDKGSHQNWRVLLSSNNIPQELETTFREQSLDSKLTAQSLKNLVLGNAHHQVTEEQIRLADNLYKSLIPIFPLLASPFTALERLEKIAEKYGARSAFLKTCASTPKLLKTLCILLDRSTFSTEILIQHPEILEELLDLPPTQIKTSNQIKKEIEALPKGETFPHFLWLYVKAEQIRTAMCNALGNWGIIQAQKHLSMLAAETLSHALSQLKLEEDCALIALGKLGGEELTYGSDLDLLILSKKQSSHDAEIRSLKKIIEYKECSISTYSLDLRLRPYGNDGPLTSTLSSLRDYYQNHAQPWEIQALTRARFIGGNVELGKDFETLKRSLLCKNPAPQKALDAVWVMREKIKKHKVDKQHPQLTLKVTEGGILDNEFLAQAIQLTLGYKYPELSVQNTLQVLESALKLNILPKAALEDNIQCFRTLQHIEWALRLDSHKPEMQIPLETNAQEHLARWSHLPKEKSFLDTYTETLKENQQSTQVLKESLKNLGLQNAPL